jgi:hypothetical protein
VSQEIKDGSTAFFVEHGNSFWRIFLGAAVAGCRISFYSGLFRLSTGKVQAMKRAE